MSFVLRSGTRSWSLLSPPFNERGLLTVSAPRIGGHVGVPCTLQGPTEPMSTQMLLRHTVCLDNTCLTWAQELISSSTRQPPRTRRHSARRPRGIGYRRPTRTHYTIFASSQLLPPDASPPYDYHNRRSWARLLLSRMVRRGEVPMKRYIPLIRLRCVHVELIGMAALYLPGPSRQRGH